MAYSCGPLSVRVDATAAGDAVTARFRAALGLFDLTWDGPLRAVDVTAARAAAPAPAARGSYLQCARLTVDTVDDGLRASTLTGVAATGAFGDDGESWTVEVPEEGACSTTSRRSSASCSPPAGGGPDGCPCTPPP